MRNQAIAVLDGLVWSWKLALLDVGFLELEGKQVYGLAMIITAM